MLVLHFKCTVIWLSSLVKMYGISHHIMTGWTVDGDLAFHRTRNPTSHFYIVCHLHLYINFFYHTDSKTLEDFIFATMVAWTVSSPCALSLSHLWQDNYDKACRFCLNFQNCHVCLIDVFRIKMLVHDSSIFFLQNVILKIHPGSEWNVQDPHVILHHVPMLLTDSVYRQHRSF